MARQGEAKTLEEQEIRFAVPTRGRLMMDLLISYLPGLLALTVQVALLVLVGRFWIVLNNAETRWVEREKPLRDATLNPKGLAEAKGAVQKQSERIPEAEKPDDKNLQPQNEAFQSPPPTGSKSVDKSSVESLSKSPRCMHDIDCRDCKIAMHAMLAIRQVFDRAVDKHTLVVVLGNSPELNTWWSGKLEPYLQRNARGHYKFFKLGAKGSEAKRLLDSCRLLLVLGLEDLARELPTEWGDVARADAILIGSKNTPGRDRWLSFCNRHRGLAVMVNSAEGLDVGAIGIPSNEDPPLSGSSPK